MKILITGGAGYIGSHTAVALACANHKVVVLDNFCNSEPDVIHRAEEISGKSIALIEGDVRDIELITHVLRNYGCEAVFHFAGFKSVGESVQKPIEYYANNVQGAVALLQAMNAMGTKILVFSSSATVYGSPQYLPIDEIHPTCAINPYGRSKLHIEEMLGDLCRSDPDWRVACLRYFNPAGAHESGLIGENPRGIPNNLIPCIAKVAANELPSLNIFGDDYPTPDGTGVRDYIHVMDLAEGHLSALNFLRNNAGWHAINLGTGRGYSVLDMIGAFEHASQKKVSRQIIQRRPGDVAACYAKVDKAALTLGWVAKRSLGEMCSSAWRWKMRMRPELVPQTRTA